MYNISTVTALSTRPSPSFICHKEPNSETSRTTRSSYFWIFGIKRTKVARAPVAVDNFCCHLTFTAYAYDDDDDYGKSRETFGDSCFPPLSGKLRVLTRRRASSFVIVDDTKAESQSRLRLTTTTVLEERLA